MKHFDFSVSLKAMKYVILFCLVLACNTTAFVTAKAESVPEKKDAQLAESQRKTNNNDFACNLFRTITEQRQDGISTIVSPISVSYVLGMLNEGADGETRRQISDVLGLGGSVEEVNKYVKKMMDEALAADSSVTVKIANCLDVISKYNIIPQYKADMQKYYNAQVDAVSYEDASGTVDKINNWCKMQTDGMIPEIIRQDELNINRVMFLLNAVYFKASWSKKFSSNETRDRDFTKQDGTIIQHQMMHRKGGAAYGENDLCKMLRLPYGNNGWSMYVLLPHEGNTIGDIIQSLSAEELEEQRRNMSSQTVDILLPRFSTESETHLEGVLSLMGMPLAFSEDAAEFPNMIEKSKVDLYVSMMKQKAKIEVTEEGTKAAAVTIAQMASRSASVTMPKIMEFHATRPFVYYIMEESTGSIFFMGTYCGDSKKIESVAQNESEEDIICTNIEQITRFPGGGKALMRYIESHTNLPPLAAENGVLGDKVIVQFVVGKDGKVGDVKVVRSVDQYLDKEAIRVIRSLPKFTPDDQAEPVVYTLPVKFRLY